MIESRHLAVLAIALSLAGCGSGGASPAGAQGSNSPSLAEARQGFKTLLRPSGGVREPVPEPPPGVFRKVTYESPVGPLPAYLTPDPKDGQKHPAIVWITGGDCNSIGDVWTDMPRSNDQSAGAFRKAGIVMMFPSLRGGNHNPGSKEGFLGEVDDVVAATEFLARQSYVDFSRIYLGGHSTGGTLVLLVAEYCDLYRAVFSFGPAGNVAGYPDEFLPFDKSNPREVELRSPGLWLAWIRVPVFVIEGAENGNVDSLKAMARASSNPQTRFFAVRGADHFSVLAPACALLADKIVHDNGSGGLSLSEQELNAAVGRTR